MDHRAQIAADVRSAIAEAEIRRPTRWANGNDFLKFLCRIGLVLAIALTTLQNLIILFQS